MNPQELPPIELFRNRLPLQLRFNDVDVLGHVNNTVYFSFYDTGKAHYFTEVRGKKADWKHVDTVIANVNCAYISPIYFGEDIEVLTACISISEKSFRLLQMLIERNTSEVKSVCETVMVCFDSKEKHSVPVSETLREDLCRYEGKKL